MAPTAAQIAQLRRLVAEPTTATYSDEALSGCIAAYPRLDERGEAPYTWDTSTNPPAQDANEDWVPTYDLHAAAADIWDEKAALLAANYDFRADGGDYQRSQAYEQALKQARYHRSRRTPTTLKAVVHPKPGTDRMAWIGNLPEED